MRVLNATCHNQKLMKEFPLAHCEPVTLVTPPYVEQPHVRVTTRKLQDVIAETRPDLSDIESQEVEELLTKYGDIFARTAMTMDEPTVYDGIDMGEARPIRQQPRRLPLVKEADMGEMLEDIQRCGDYRTIRQPLLIPCCSHPEEQGPMLLCRLQETKLSQERTLSHCPRLTTLWAPWQEPNGSPLWT
jgi:hypothetical protein